MMVGLWDKQALPRHCQHEAKKSNLRTTWSDLDIYECTRCCAAWIVQKSGKPTRDDTGGLGY